MATSRHHVRTGSYGRKVVSSFTKVSRPTLTAKRSSAGSGSKAAPSRPPSKSGSTSSDYEDEDYEDAASFLQFCATCEKQIVTPSVSVLYCSEACKRRDSTTSTTLPTSAPASPASAAFSHPPRNLLPYRSPTVLRPISKTYSELSLYELDQDDKLRFDMLSDSTFGMPTQARPYFKRSNTSPESSGSPSQVPSLVNSPCSSYGAAPVVDTARPLPRKHSCPIHKGIDLVTPLIGVCDYAQASVEPRRISAPATAAAAA